MVKTEMGDEETALMCRICRSGTGQLVSACGCLGSVGAVHVACLERWFKFSNSVCCEICQQPFQVTMQPIPFRVWCKTIEVRLLISYLLIDLAVLFPSLASSILCLVMYNRISLTYIEEVVLATALLVSIALTSVCSLMCVIDQNKLLILWRRRRSNICLFSYKVLPRFCSGANSDTDKSLDSYLQVNNDIEIKVIRPLENKKNSLIKKLNFKCSSHPLENISNNVCTTHSRLANENSSNACDVSTIDTKSEDLSTASHSIYVTTLNLDSQIVKYKNGSTEHLTPAKLLHVKKELAYSGSDDNFLKDFSSSSTYLELVNGKINGKVKHSKVGPTPCDTFLSANYLQFKNRLSLNLDNNSISLSMQELKEYKLNIEDRRVSLKSMSYENVHKTQSIISIHNSNSNVFESCKYKLYPEKENLIHSSRNQQIKIEDKLSTVQVTRLPSNESRMEPTDNSLFAEEHNLLKYNIDMSDPACAHINTDHLFSQIESVERINQVEDNKRKDRRFRCVSANNAPALPDIEI